MGARQSHRQAGLGSVQKRTRAKGKYWALEPQTRGVTPTVIGRFDTRWAAERALSAWYVVRAVVMLAQRLREPCDSRIAS